MAFDCMAFNVWKGLEKKSGFEVVINKINELFTLKA